MSRSIPVAVAAFALALSALGCTVFEEEPAVHFTVEGPQLTNAYSVATRVDWPGDGSALLYLNGRALYEVPVNVATRLDLSSATDGTAVAFAEVQDGPVRRRSAPVHLTIDRTPPPVAWVTPRGVVAPGPFSAAAQFLGPVILVDAVAFTSPRGGVIATGALSADGVTVTFSIPEVAQETWAGVRVRDEAGNVSEVSLGPWTPDVLGLAWIEPPPAVATGTLSLRATFDFPRWYDVRLLGVPVGTLLPGQRLDIDTRLVADGTGKLTLAAGSDNADLYAPVEFPIRVSNGTP